MSSQVIDSTLACSTFLVAANRLPPETESRAMSQTSNGYLEKFIFQQLEHSNDLQRSFLCGVLDELRQIDFDSGDEWYHAGRTFIADLTAGREPASIPAAAVNPVIITGLRQRVRVHH